jgi:hypothetical protein
VITPAFAVKHVITHRIGNIRRVVFFLCIRRLSFSIMHGYSIWGRVLIPGTMEAMSLVECVMAENANAYKWKWLTQKMQILKPFQDTLKQNLKILPTYAHYRSQVMQSFVSLKVTWHYANYNFLQLLSNQSNLTFELI